MAGPESYLRGRSPDGESFVLLEPGDFEALRDEELGDGPSRLWPATLDAMSANKSPFAASSIQPRRASTGPSEGSRVRPSAIRHALLTADEAAEYLRVSTKTISRYVVAGRLVALRLPGGQRRFRSADLERLLEAVTTCSEDIEAFIRRHE